MLKTYAWFDEPIEVRGVQQCIQPRIERMPYGQNIGHIISPVPQNSDQPEKTRFLTFSVGARRLWVHLVAMAAGFVNYTLRGVGSDHCENTNRGCVGHR
ncbi:MAG: hypothetical protein ABSD31_16105, partial [Candidatus Binataceae bacterium]